MLREGKESYPVSPAMNKATLGRPAFILLFDLLAEVIFRPHLLDGFVLGLDAA